MSKRHRFILKNKIIYWEDLIEGSYFEYGHYEVNENEIIEFVTKYNPLPHHFDPISAQSSPLGVLCGSGLHTIGMAHKMLCDNFSTHTKLDAGRGIDKINMLAPVLLGDKLGVKLQVSKTLAHSTKKIRGWTFLSVVIYRGEGEIVMTLVILFYFYADHKNAFRLELLKCFDS